MKMQKKIPLIFLIVLLAIFCLNVFVSKNEELKTGKYNFEKDGIEDYAYIEILPDNSYKFSRDIAISHLSTGQYEINGNELKLKDSSEKDFYFKIEKDKLIFINPEDNIQKSGDEFVYKNE